MARKALQVVILSLTSYLGLANFGLGQTVGNMVAEAAAKTEKGFLREVVSTAFFFHALIAMPLLLIAVLLALGHFVRFLPLQTHSANIALAATCVRSTFTAAQGQLDGIAQS